MNTMVKTAAKLAILLIFMTITLQVYAAGDYVWEAKFAKELPKAEQGIVKSQYAIGEMYEKGKGTEKNDQEALRWYIKAANKGDKKSAYKVGLFYYEGRAITKSYRIARTWLTKSADKRYARAEFYLGEIYEYGRGVSRNNSTALKWYKRALAGGYGTASEGIQRVASAQAASKKISPARKPKRTPTPAVSRKSAKPPIETILKGGWKKRKRPAEYLPSSVNKCKRVGKNLECESSKPLKRNIGMADINYISKVIIFGFKSDGRFKISYRNNVKSIKVTSEEFAESGEAVPVKLGWQDAEHKLACTVEDSKKITCIKNNKTRKIILTR